MDKYSGKSIVALLWVIDEMATGLEGWKSTESRAFMLVLVFSVQSVTHTGRLHRYLPSKASSSRPWDAEDARRLSCGVAASSSVEFSGSSSSGGDTTTSGIP